jgi:hypothetical protein
VATSVSFVMTLLLMLFGGFYVMNERIPPGIQWVKYISFLYWGYSNFLLNEFRGNTIPCSFARPFEFSPVCPIEGDRIVEARGFSKNSIWVGMIMLIFFIVFFRYAAYWCLRYKAKLRI